MKKHKHKKSKHVLINICMQEMAQKLSLVVVPAATSLYHKTRDVSPRSTKKHLTDSTPRARKLSLLGASSLPTDITLETQASSAPRARKLSLLRSQALGLLLIAGTILPLASAFLPSTPLSNILPFTPETASAAPADTLNFQGRLLTGTGGLVPDGDYHIEFKLYNVDTGGAALWTETRTTGNLVTISNGYYSVYLGDVTALPAIDWSQELYLTMNVGGSGGSASYDGEMTPRFKMTAVPFAFSAQNVASGDTNAVSANSDGVSIQTGDALGATSNSGNLTVDTGTATGTTGTISVGATNASAVAVGNGSSTFSLNSTALDISATGVLSGATGITSSGTITFSAFDCTSYANGGVLTTNGSGVLECQNDDGGGAAPTLQSAYDNGNTILSTDASDVSFTLADTTTDANFVIDIATSSTSKFAVQSNGTDLLRVDSSGIDLIDVDVADFTGSTVTFDANEIVDAEVSNTLTASNLVGTGSTTDGVDLATAEVNGTLGVDNGGTGAATLAANGVLYGNDTGAIQATAVGATNQCLLGNTGSAPTWGSCTAGGGAFTNLSLDGDSGTAETLGDTDTINILGGTNINTLVSATDTLTVNLDNSPTLSGTLTVQGNTVIGNANTDTLTINAGSDGTGITFGDASFQSCVLETNASGVVTCGTDGGDGVGIAALTLSADSGPDQALGDSDTIEIAGGTDIDSVASATDTVTLNNASTLATVSGRGATTTTLLNLDGGLAVDTSNFTVNGTTGAVATSGGLTVSAGGASITGNSTIATGAGNTLSVGNGTGALTVTGDASSSFVLNGVTVDDTEFNRLDGKNAALVDTNDAVVTAITGAGALDAGSITSGFGAIDNASTITGTVLNGTTSINTGAGAGTVRITSTGILQNVTNANAGTFFTAGTLGVARGGTGLSSYTTGDLIYASGATALSNLTAVASGSCLISQGVGVAPVWGSCTAGGGITSLNGETGASQTLQTGTAGTDFAIVTTADTHTFNIPDAASGARGLVTTAAQTFAGIKTFATDVVVNGDLTVDGDTILGNASGDTTTINGTSLTLGDFDCTGNTNGGVLTANGSGVVSCTDDDGDGVGIAALSLGADSGTAEALADTDTIIIAGGTNADTTVSATDTVTVNVVSNPTFSGLITANGGVTFGASDLLTLAGDAFDDLTGTGLQIVSNELQTTLGVSVDLATAEVNGILADGNVSDTLTIGASSTVADGALSANVSLLGSSIQDAEVDDDLTISGSGSVADGALSANVSLLGATIDLTSEITGTLAVASGGTGATTASGARGNLGAAASGSNSDITAITGLTTDLSIAQGGTNASTAQAAINNLSGLTTDGDLLYHNGTNSTRLARGATDQCLVSTATTVQWASCTAGGGNSLQAAYDTGNTILATDGRDIDITLANTATDPSFTIDIATGAGGKFAVQNNGTDAFRVDSSGIDLIDVDVADFTGANVTFDANEITDAEVSNILTASNLVGSGSTTNAVDLATAEVNGILADGNVSDTLTIGASSTVADGALSANVSLLGSSIQDAEVDDDLTISGSGSVADGALSANVSLLGATIDLTSEITGTLAVVNGGTGSTTASGARANLSAASSGANSDITSITGLTTDLSVSQGGTGASSLTSGGVLLGSGTAAIATTGVLTNGQLLIGDGTGAPTVAALTQGAGITVTNGAGSITIASTLGTSVDLASAEVTGVLPDGNVSDTLTIGASSTVADGALSANVSLLGASIDLASEITGTLAVANGGTGSTTASGARSNIGAAQSGANSDITSITGLTTDLTVAQGGTGGSSFTNNGIIYGNAGGALSVTAASTGAGQCLITAVSGGVPSWGTCTGDGEGIASLTLSADSGSNQPLGDGDTIEIAGGTDINSVASATDTVTLNNASTLATVSGRGATTTTLLNLNGGIAVDTSNFTVNGTNGNVLTAGDLAVNGGDITSTGDLTVAPAGLDTNITGRLNVTGTAEAVAKGAIVDIAGSLTDNTGIQYGLRVDPAVALTASPASSTTYDGVNSIIYTGDADSATNVTLQGVVGGVYVDGVSLEAANGLVSYVEHNGAGILADAVGLYVQENLDTGGGSVTNSTGIRVVDQRAGSARDVGVEIEGADTYALWVGSKANYSNAENGITFGSSGNTNLYRGGNNLLQTDDSLTVALDLAVNGGDLTTTAGTLNLFNANATDVNAFGAADTLDLGVIDGSRANILNDNLYVGNTGFAQLFGGGTSGFAVVTEDQSGAGVASGGFYTGSGNAAGTVANSGEVQLTSGTATGTSGNILVDAGFGTIANGTVSVGTSNASALLLGNSSAPLTVTGSSASTFVLDGTTITAAEFNVLNNGIEAGDLITQGTATDEFCLTYEGGGGALLEWQSCGGGASDLQGSYDAGSAGDQVIALDATNDSLIVRNPASSGSNSGSAALTVDQLNTGAVKGLLVNSAGTANFFEVQDAGTSVFSIANNGDVTIEPVADSANAVRIVDNLGFDNFRFETESGGSGGGTFQIGQSTRNAQFSISDSSDYNDDLFVRLDGGDGTSAFVFQDEGRFGVNRGPSDGPTATIDALITTASYVGLRVQGAASQTANLVLVENDGGDDLVVVDSSGNVGIGVAAPVAKLDVAGSTRLVANAANSITGSITPAGSVYVTGVGTAFTTELAIGDRITVNSETRTVVYITDDTNLEVFPQFTAGSADSTLTRTPAILYALDNANSASLIASSDGLVGIGTAPAYTLDVYATAPNYGNGDQNGIAVIGGTLASTTERQAGLVVNPQVNPGSEGSGPYNGIVSQIQSSSTIIGDAALSGFRSIPQVSGTADVTQLNGYTTELEQYSSATIANVAGFRVEDIINSGTITNTYGLYVGDITTGTQTNGAYGLYVSDANAGNYVAGGLTIGDVDTTGVLLTVDDKTSSGDPTGINGSIYYNSDADKFRCYENSAWADCISAGGTGTNEFTVVVAANDSVNSAAADYTGDGDAAGANNGDQVQIQSAIDDAVTAGGGTVFLLEGTFVIDNMIELDDNITLMGSGPATIIQSGADGGSNNSFDMITNEDAANASGGNNNITIRDLHIDGNSASVTASSRHAIDFDYVGSGVGNAVVAGFTVEDVSIEDSTDKGITSTQSFNSKINNVQIVDTADHGIEFQNSDQLTITNNHIADPANGIYLSDVDYAVVSGNLIEEAGSEAIIIDGSGSSRGNIIDSNQIIFNGRGIELSGGNDFTVISNNYIGENTNQGIDSAGGDNLSITGNTFRENDSGGSGETIELSGDTNNAIITDNLIEDESGGGQSHAINISASTVDNTYIADNHFMTTDGITDSGTGTIYGGQVDNSSDFNIDTGGDLIVVGTGTTCTIGSGTGTTSCTSDERLKENIQGTTGNLSKILGLNAVSYNWISDENETQRIGLIAQNVQAILPQAVNTGADGFLQVDYGVLISPLIGAVHELDVLITANTDQLAVQTQTLGADIAANSSAVQTNASEIDILETDLDNGMLQFVAVTSATTLQVEENIDSIETNTEKIATLETNLDNGMFPAVAVAGATTTANLQVTETAQITELTVIENANILADLTVQGITTVQDLTVQGKIISSGDVPEVENGLMLGLDDITAIEGTDIAGSVALTTDVASAPIGGEVALITFDEAYTQTPRIALTPTNIDSASVRVYPEVTATGFVIHSLDPLASDTTYTFDYIIIQ